MRASSDAITDNKTERVEIKLKCVTIFFHRLFHSLCAHSLNYVMEKSTEDKPAILKTRWRSNRQWIDLNKLNGIEIIVVIRHEIREAKI